MELSLKEITDFLDKLYPLQYQESYDNSGLLTDTADPIKKCIVCLDVTETLVEEAIATGANLIVSHHPLIFNGLKRITDSEKCGKIIKKLITHKIALYAAHTNFDNAKNGINDYIAQLLNLTDVEVIAPLKKHLLKLTTFVPNSYVDKVRTAILNSGAGSIGNYDSCSFIAEGEGSFRANEFANPFAGQKGDVHYEPETRIETIIERQNLQKSIAAMLKAHPYETAAYDIYPLENKFTDVGAGRFGNLPYAMTELQLIEYLKEKLLLPIVGSSCFKNRKIVKTALCSGSGSMLIEEAIKGGAAAFITGDVKHHQYIDYGNDILILDVGHHESEKYCMNIFYEVLTKKFTNFAVYISNSNKSPITYI